MGGTESFRTWSTRTRWQGAPRVARQPRRPRPPQSGHSPRAREGRSPCWAPCPSPLEPPDAQAQCLGLFPRPDLVSTGLGDAGKARFQPWARIQRTVTPNPQALAGNTPQHCPARAAQLRVWPGGQLSTLLSLRGRGGTRSRTPPTPGGLDAEGRGQPSICTLIG